MAIEDNVNDVIKFINEEVIPLVIATLDFKESDLQVCVDDTAFFTNQKRTNSHYAKCYFNAIDKIEKDVMDKINILTARKKALNDNIRYIELYKDENKNKNEIDYLKNILNEVEMELQKFTNKYKVIENADIYLGDLSLKILRYDRNFKS